MIRVVMLGRLGNNLFQYAFGRALAERHGVPLVLDASWFNGRTWPYVEPLRQLPGMTSGMARITRPFSFGSRALRKLTRKHHWEYSGKPIVREKPDDHSYEAELLKAPGDCVVFGYFQSPMYFDGIECQLRSELSTAKLGLETGLESIAAELKKPTSVAVHVRRGDYVNNPNLILLGLDYYHRAMELIVASVPNARFFVFSDDSGWCKKHFHQANVYVMTHSDIRQPLVDLHLMSLASHHIISNSSYSWWAAWLGAKANQLVLMPDQWFKGSIYAPVSEKKCAGWQTIAC